MTEHQEDLHDPRLTDLYRRRDGEQPPARLDAEVRKAAHAAVRRPVSRRLWPSLATAAVLVLGVSVALLVFEQPEMEQPGLDPGFDRSMPAPPRSAAPLVDEHRARREAVAPLESKSSLAPTAVPPGLSIQGRVAPAPAGAEEELRADVRERVETGRAPVRPSRTDETLPAVDCDAYGNLSEQSEAELQELLEAYRQTGDRAAIHCLSQGLDQVRERARERVQRVRPAAQ